MFTPVKDEAIPFPYPGGGQPAAMVDPAPLEVPASPERKPRFAPYRGVQFSTSLKWLFAGTLIYALMLLVMIVAKPLEATFPIVGPSLYLTPLFGLPLVLRLVHRPGRIRRLIYFMILLPIVHIAANYVAWGYAVTNFYQLDAQGVLMRDLTAGAWGGVTGATLALTLLHLMGLTARRRAELVTMGAATIALTVAGALGMAQGLVFSGHSIDTHDTEAVILWYESIHLPWQAVFSVVLAWLMRPPKRARKPVTSLAP